jgi:hypothetical protein
MYPNKTNYQNAVQIKFIDNKDENTLIRSFFTQEPEMFLKMYTFAQENDLDVDITLDMDNENNEYSDMIGTVKNIIITTGDRDICFPTVEIYLEVRDYR